MYYTNLAANTAAELAEKMLLFGGFLLYPFDNSIQLDSGLQNLHDLLVHRYGNGTYPTRAILRSFAPKCEDLIMRCVVKGTPMNCSQMFFTRTTAAGMCCLFNYRRNSDNNDNEDLLTHEANSSFETNKIRFEGAGLYNSLQVVLQDDVDDYSMKEYPCDTFRAFLFYPYDYPDPETGTVTKALAGYNEDSEVSIQPDILEGSPRMQQFSSKMRHCFFLEEGQELLNTTYYSFSECMLMCRTRSLVNHCGCMVPVLPGYIDGVPYCVLLDLPCLKLWKAIWWQWNSFDYVSEGKQWQSTLELCKHCLPSCNIMSYKVTANSRPLNIPRDRENFSVGILNGISTSKPTTVVSFFYKTTFSQVKTHDISGDWIVLLGRYGGLCSVMYGFSIIAIIEILYFVTGKWGALWWKCLRENYRKHSVHVETHQELYWDELKPKRTFPIREINKF